MCFLEDDLAAGTIAGIAQRQAHKRGNILTIIGSNLEI